MKAAWLAREETMFGRPHFADTAFMLAEVHAGLAATATALEGEHPDPSATDAQALFIWVFAAITHPIMLWGRTSQDALVAVYYESGMMMGQRPRADMWSEEEATHETNRLDAALRDHVKWVSYEGIAAASAVYYRGLLHKVPPPNLTEEQFVRLTAPSMFASVTRLQAGGYLKAH